MSGTVSFLLKSARIALDVTDVVQQASKEDKTTEDKINLAAKSIFTFFESASFLGYYGDAGLSHQKLTLAGELGGRIALTITEPIKEIINDRKPFNTVLENIAGIFRITGDMQIVQEKQYLALPADEFASTQRPVYSCDIEGNCEVIGYRPLNRQECQETIERLTTVSKIAESVEILSKNVVVNTTIKTFENFCEFFRNHRVAQLVQQDAAIPEEYYDDPVLAEFICPITLCPIRHPVIDPTSNTVYEAEAIISWVVSNGTSPLSRERLNVGQLLPAPQIQARIDNRLREMGLI